MCIYFVYCVVYDIGLQNTGAQSSSVRRLLSSIQHKIVKSIDLYRDGFNNQLIALACYGLRSLTEKVKVSYVIGVNGTSTAFEYYRIAPEVVNIILDLSTLISISQARLTPSQLALASLGMQNLGADTSAARTLLSALYDKCSYLLPQSNTVGGVGAVGVSVQSAPSQAVGHKVAVTAQEITMVCILCALHIFTVDSLLPPPTL